MTRKFTLPEGRDLRAEIDFEADLNAEQFAAVTCSDGPKLVIAGAGTGKTRTLTYRVAWLLSQGIAADRILLVTFTNKAAREMLERVPALTRNDTRRLWGGTFHSVGARLLRRHAEIFGYTDSFSILDASDQLDLLRLCISDVGIEVERRLFPSAKVLRSLLSLHANTRTPVDDLLVGRYPQFLDWQDKIQDICQRYGARKLAANAMDYDDLLLLWLRLLREAPEITERYAEQFRYILVDEYQDTNLIQGEIVETLAARNGRNLMVVGDDCQSIYAFRGAHYDNILSFPQRNPGTEIFKLEVNYRSTPEILELTNISISGNPDQYPKQLNAPRNNGLRPALVACNDPDQEATFVAERILQLRDENIPLRNIAVLYRAHSHRLAVETTLLRYGIPYEVRGGLRFFEQAHIKDVTAYLRVADNPRDEVAFRRVALLQPGIGNVTARRAWQALGRVSTANDLLVGLRGEAVEASVGTRGRAGLETLRSVFADVIACHEQPEAAIRAVLDGSYAAHAAAHFTNHESRLEELEQLAVFAAQYDDVGGFLQELVLLGELYAQDVDGAGDDTEHSAVVLSTIHQSKGLEWEVVFLVHLADGALPSQRALEEPGGEQEERRIFYVAMTRARTELYLSYPIVKPAGGGGALMQQASRFIQELPPELMETWDLVEAPRPRAARSPAARRSLGLDEFDPNIDPLWDDD